MILGLGKDYTLVYSATTNSGATWMNDSNIISWINDTNTQWTLDEQVGEITNVATLITQSTSEAKLLSLMMLNIQGLDK